MCDKKNPYDGKKRHKRRKGQMKLAIASIPFCAFCASSRRSFFPRINNSSHEEPAASALPLNREEGFDPIGTTHVGR